ncbi:hypothetical protein BD770DRAFT_387270 [Pilaira anomala]|nr:hypothetical protein BD770DRAFT_387270 [Pilaira anomala]
MVEFKVCQYNRYSFLSFFIAYMITVFIIQKDFKQDIKNSWGVMLKMKFFSTYVIISSMQKKL